MSLTERGRQLQAERLAEDGKYAAATEDELFTAVNSFDDELDGAELLDELHTTFCKYVAFPDKHSAVAVTLWVTATHALPAFECAPRLSITSPEKRCGKTRLLDIIGATCHDALATSDATVAAIFRSLGGNHPPTLVIDEADAIFGSKKAAEQNEDLRKLLNAGHQRGRPALRCVGPSQIPTKFPVFSMAALAGIGAMPDTITDRAINISMRRRASAEKVSQFRSRRDGPALEGLRNRLAAWAAEHIDELKTAEPAMPVEDRAADTWEPLTAVADAAGGHWPKLARDACKALVDAADEADEERSLSTKLLADVRSVFIGQGVSFLPSAELVAGLRRIEESPWDDFELTSRKLAYRLKEFGVKPERIGHDQVRGYKLESLRDAFSRYIRLHPSASVAAQVNPQKRADGSQNADGSIRLQTDRSVCSENIRLQETAAQTLFADGWTDADGCPPENGQTEPRFTPPTGPGRCSDCGCHTPTQGHLDGCPANKGTTP